MGSEDSQQSEDFSLEIDSVVEDFFSHYEENAPKMDTSDNDSETEMVSEEDEIRSEEAIVLETDDASPEFEADIALKMDDTLDELESDITSEDENGLVMDDSSFDPLFDILSETENAQKTNDSSSDIEPDMPDMVAENGETAPEEHNKRSDNHPANRHAATNDSQLFNSLTEAILTLDWEVNDTNVKKASDILETILETFPIIQESRAKEVADGMLTTLNAIAAFPQRVPPSATVQLEKAIPIIQRICSGAQMEDGYDELIENAIAGFETFRSLYESATLEKSEPPSPTPHTGISFDDGSVEGSETEGLSPMSVPMWISHALSHHSEVLAQLTPRARRLSESYTAAARGSENVQALLQKICGLLDLQTRALEDVFSPNCSLAIFPVGAIKNLSDFFSFQLKAMGVCIRHAGVLENTFKNHPHRKRFRQSIFLLRMAMQRQLDELSIAAKGDDAPSDNTEAAISAPLSEIIRKHLLAMEECMERVNYIVECQEGCDHNRINEAARLLREKLAGQTDILRRAIG